jgi:ABC-type nitrate/sulfonate/bicarbonate transport system substrate-binding protein
MAVRVGGVPEHFNYPWRLAKERGYFNKHNVEVEWTTYQNGTGSMINALRNGQVDVIVALTEGLVSESLRGGDFQLFGTYVQSPLRWAVITGHNSPYQSVEDLKGETFAISRFTSGSHLMAGVLASNYGWDVNEVQFKVVGSLKDLKDSVNSGETAAFLWEYFMTKPYADSGEVRFIGEISTPWSCFMMAARKDFLESNVETLHNLLEGLQEAIRDFYTEPGVTEDIAKEFGLQLDDAKMWHSSVTITGVPSISEDSLTKAITALQQIEVLDPNEPINPSSVVFDKIASIS